MRISDWSSDVCSSDLLEGRDHGFKSRELMLHEDLPGLRTAQQAINQWYIDWSNVQSAESLDEIVRFRFISGEPGAMTRGEILLHVVNHATYHRGWIADMFFRVPAQIGRESCRERVGQYV